MWRPTCQATFRFSFVSVLWLSCRLLFRLFVMFCSQVLAIRYRQKTKTKIVKKRSITKSKPIFGHRRMLITRCLLLTPCPHLVCTSGALAGFTVLLSVSRTAFAGIWKRYKDTTAVVLQIQLKKLLAFGLTPTIQLLPSLPISLYRLVASLSKMLRSMGSMGEEVYLVHFPIN